MSEQPIPENPMYATAFKRMRRFQTIRRFVRRVGCGLAIIIWLGVMLIPCLLVNLMVQREIIIPRSDIPEHEYRLFLLQSADERGFLLQTGSIQSGGEDAAEVCILTSTRYLMWEGEGENLSYCNCYEKVEGEWSAVMVGGDETCQPLSEPTD